jgi:hypothetical protein
VGLFFGVATFSGCGCGMDGPKNMVPELTCRLSGAGRSPVLLLDVRVLGRRA